MKAALNQTTFLLLCSWGIYQACSSVREDTKTKVFHQQNAGNISFIVFACGSCLQSSVTSLVSFQFSISITTAHSTRACGKYVELGIRTWASIFDFYLSCAQIQPGIFGGSYRPQQHTIYHPQQGMMPQQGLYAPSMMGSYARPQPIYEPQMRFKPQPQVVRNMWRQALSGVLCHILSLSLPRCATRCLPCPQSCIWLLEDSISSSSCILYSIHCPYKRTYKFKDVYLSHSER